VDWDGCDVLTDPKRLGFCCGRADPNRPDIIIYFH
jgi:hypothetical protein